MTHAAPRYARPFVAAFLLAIVVCALAPLNLWPFSNWELFSRLRSAQETSWQAVARERDGRVVDYAIGAHVRCSRLLHGPTTRVRVYRVERLLSDRLGNRAAPPRRRLVFTCTAKGFRAAS